MLIRLISDTHLETGKQISIPRMQEDGETVLVLAGDIGSVEEVQELVEELMEHFLAIVFITGNHEYYDITSDKLEIDSVFDNMFSKYENAHFLNNTSIVIEGVTFIGSTLWSNITDKLELMGSIKHKLNDFRLIKYYPEDSDDGFVKAVTPEEMGRWNTDSIKYLEEIIPRTKGEIVVVTHFSPSIESTHMKYFGDLLNPYFHNRLEPLLNSNKLTWLHGHTHSSCNYSIGESRVYCNPWGYYDIYVENPDFEPYLRIEI